MGVEQPHRQELDSQQSLELMGQSQGEKAQPQTHSVRAHMHTYAHMHTLRLTLHCLMTESDRDKMGGGGKRTGGRPRTKREEKTLTLP